MQDQDFFQQVFRVVRQIPPGRVTSYGAIAHFLGTGASARVVGWAMNSASKMEDVPAHRVVNRIGLLTGKHHFPGSRAMQELLEEEGVAVVADKVVDFERIFWDPAAHL